MSSLNQLLLWSQHYFLGYKTSYLNLEVNSTEPSLQLGFPVEGDTEKVLQWLMSLKLIYNKNLCCNDQKYDL
jgi:hypothetical protein